MSAKYRDIIGGRRSVAAVAMTEHRPPVEKTQMNRVSFQITNNQ